MAKILSCTCGDCKHWELVQNEDGVGVDAGYELKCMTCTKSFPLVTDSQGGLIIPEADHLVWTSVASA